MSNTSTALKQTSSDGSAPASFVRSPSSDAKLLRKIDLRLLPILTLLYLLSFLDRSNIGNARLDGLAADLHIVGSNYNVALFLFFLGYVLFEVPSQLVLKKLNPKIWLPTLAFLYGVVSVIQGLVVNQAGLFAVRFFLGVAECGLFPGCVFVFSTWYPRHLRHYRVALFFSGAALAGAFGGVLAYGIGFMRGLGGKNGWSWIFIIEGLVTVVASVGSYFLIPASVGAAPFLKEHEKEHVLDMLKEGDGADNEPFNWLGVRQALTDPQAYGYALLFHAHSFALYSISLFAPTIISLLGYRTWQAQLLSTPPYALAFIVTMVGAYASHKVNKRGPFIVGFDLVAVIGYIVLITHKTPASAYIGLFLIIGGIYAATALVLSWPSENISSQTKRATTLGMQITIGNLGAITSVLIYRPKFSAHVFRKPNIISLCYMLGGAAIATILLVTLSRANRRRDALQAESAVNEKGNIRSVEERDERLRLGDRHPGFRYQL